MPRDTTALQDGNQALRSGRADQAIRHYALALADAEPSATPIGRTPSAAPGPIGQQLAPNLLLARKRYRRQRQA